MGDSVLWQNFSLNCYQFPSPTAILCFYIFVFPNHQLLSQHFTSKDKGTSLFLCLRYSAKSLPSGLTPRDPMNCSPPGASVLGILQARILEWVAMHSSRGTCPPGVKPASPAWAGGSSPSEPSRKPSPGGASAALKRGRGSGGHGEVGDGRCEGLEPPLLAVKMQEGTRVQRMPEAS